MFVFVSKQVISCNCFISVLVLVNRNKLKCIDKMKSANIGKEKAPMGEFKSITALKGWWKNRAS